MSLAEGTSTPERGKFCLLQPDLYLKPYQMLKSRNQFYRVHIVECLVYISNKLIEWKEIQDLAQFSILTSPFLTVMDCLRGVISSLILDRKF